MFKENPVNKNKISEELSSIRNLFTKSICTKLNVKAGELITKDMLVLKKPGGGIPIDKIDNILGKV